MTRPTLVHWFSVMIQTTAPVERLTESAHAEAEPTAPGTQLLDEPRVATMLPPQLLQGGEIIVLLIKPSPWFIVLESLGSLAVLAIFLACGMTLVNAGFIGRSQLDLLIAGVGLAALLRLFWQFLEWISRVYVLTDQRIVRVKGVLRVEVFETSLKNIQHTTTVFSIRERLFGLGTIGFATAGTANHEAAWAMVARPLEVNQIVVETMNRYR